jgi:hypothetical protein
MFTATVTNVIKHIRIKTDMNKEEMLLKLLMKYTFNNVHQEK